MTRPWICFMRYSVSIFGRDILYAVFLFHGRYDVPVKGTDKEWQEGSEEIYEYLILTVSPLTGDV